MRGRVKIVDRITCQPQLTLRGGGHFVGDFKMDLEKAIAYIAKEWQTIAQAPAIFTVAILLISVVIWAVVNWSYSSKFEGQSSIIASLEIVLN